MRLFDGEITSRVDAKRDGLTHYFTGKPCKHGHIDMRQTCNWDCRECVRLRNSEWRKENPERVRALDAQWWAANRDRKLEHCKKWRDNNPEKVRQYKLDALTRRRGGAGRFTLSDVAQILSSQGNTCVGPKCGVDLKGGYHVDHIMPLILGGSNHPSNLQCLCQKCNLSKGGKHPDDWIGRPL